MCEPTPWAPSFPGEVKRFSKHHQFTKMKQLGDQSPERQTSHSRSHQGLAEVHRITTVKLVIIIPAGFQLSTVLLGSYTLPNMPYLQVEISFLYFAEFIKILSRRKGINLNNLPMQPKDCGIGWEAWDSDYKLLHKWQLADVYLQLNVLWSEMSERKFNICCNQRLYNEWFLRT